MTVRRGSTAASVVFLSAHLIDWRIGIPLAVSNLVGGYIGAQLAVKSSERVVRALFLATVAGLALKLLAYDLCSIARLPGPDSNRERFVRAPSFARRHSREN